MPSSSIHTSGSPDYEALRLRYNNSRVPPRHPTEIITPTSAEDVAAALKRAYQQNLKVGIRSGGHQWTCTSLLNHGILLDTQKLNHEVIYDSKLETITFGPACTGAEMSTAMQKVSRFFPHGHSPTVAMGGFLAAGGQGWFFRGWGLTCETWILQIEVVTASGDILICNREQNADLFWAASGSGQGMFFVVTKYWGRTIPARKVWQSQVVFHSAGEGYEEIMEWALRANDGTEGEGTDCALGSFYAEKYENSDTEEIKDRSKLMIVVAAVAYTDTLAEAQRKLEAYGEDKIPERLRRYVAVVNPTRPATWEELFRDQDNFNPAGNGERWQCGSILTDPSVSRAELIRTLRPALCDLPTRRSVGCIAFADVNPREENQAASIPQQYYIASMICWTDPQQDDEMDRWLTDVNEKIAPVALGVYVADFNAQFAVKKVLSDTAFEEYTKLRKQWDPKELFQGFRGLNGYNIER